MLLLKLRVNHPGKSNFSRRLWKTSTTSFNNSSKFGTSTRTCFSSPISRRAFGMKYRQPTRAPTHRPQLFLHPASWHRPSHPIRPTEIWRRCLSIIGSTWTVCASSNRPGRTASRTEPSPSPPRVVVAVLETATTTMALTVNRIPIRAKSCCIGWTLIPSAATSTASVASEAAAVVAAETCSTTSTGRFCLTP